MVARRAPVVVLLLVAAMGAGACQSAAPGSAAPGSLAPSVPALTPTAAPSAPDFGDIAALRDALASAGFRAGVSPQGYVTLTSGTSVVVTLTPDTANLGQFQAVSLEVAPLSALDDDPTARPAIDVVFELFDWWSPQAAERARQSLRDSGTTTSRAGASEHQERREATTPDGFRLITEFSYGGQSTEDDYFRTTLSRD